MEYTLEQHQVQLQKLEALGQFSGGIAHDFNNILSIIEGQTSIAVKQLREGRLTEEQLKKVLTSTQRGAGLTRQLLSFSRNKISLPETLNLCDVLEQQKTLLNPLLGATINFFMTLPKNPVYIESSQDQIMQIIMNLTLNARDALPKGGNVSVLLMQCQQGAVPDCLRMKNPEKEFILLSVSDDGEGIPPDVLPKIFDPFFTTKDQGKGTGLGLSVVYGIIDQMMGYVEVSSEPGQGARFDVYLPLSSPACEKAAPFVETTGQPLSLEGKTILVAEDEAELRDVLEHTFSDLKMKVLMASNGNHALLVQEEYEGEIDFLLTDIVMPEMDGAKLGELFTSLRPDTNIVYMSGYPFMDGRKDIRLPEGATLIGKPLHQEKLQQILQRALERRDERLGILK